MGIKLDALERHLILKIVGVLPHVDREQRGAELSSRRRAHALLERELLVRGRDDLELWQPEKTHAHIRWH